MQSPIPFTSPRAWMDYIVYLLAILLAGGWYREWRDRKKTPADIRLSNAQAEKTLAEAHKIILDDAMEALDEAKRTIEAQKATIAKQESDLEDYELVKAQNMVMEIQIKKYEEEKKRSKGH